MIVASIVVTPEDQCVPRDGYVKIGTELMSATDYKSAVRFLDAWTAYTVSLKPDVPLAAITESELRTLHGDR